jgi:DNA-binding transcriptional LysR family regulator
MNPFTKSLAAKLGTSKLQDFIAHWDALEQLVIRVYRGKAVTEADEAEYTQLRAWLQANYEAWREALQPHWQQAKIAGKLATEDPFAKLFTPQHAADFLNNWPALQALPAAREGLNRLVIG